MESEKFDKDKIIKYWVESSDDDFDTMIAMYENKRYGWSLFVGHLMIEKLLKALFVKINNDYPPFIHNLLRLAEMSDIELSETQKIFLITVTAFNINTRYDDYKRSFHQTCTPSFTLTWFEQIKIQRTWIKSLIEQ